MRTRTWRGMQTATRREGQGRCGIQTALGAVQEATGDGGSHRAVSSRIGVLGASAFSEQGFPDEMRPTHAWLVIGFWPRLMFFRPTGLDLASCALYAPSNLLSGVARHDTRIGGSVASFTVWHGSGAPLDAGFFLGSFGAGVVCRFCRPCSCCPKCSRVKREPGCGIGSVLVRSVGISGASSGPCGQRACGSIGQCARGSLRRRSALGWPRRTQCSSRSSHAAGAGERTRQCRCSTSGCPSPSDEQWPSGRGGFPHHRT